MAIALNRLVSGVQSEMAMSGTKTMVNNDVIFTVVGGPIIIDELMSICVTANDATASTLQYRSNPTVGTATAISGATATLASSTAGTTIRLMPTALSTAPAIVTDASGGVQLGQNVANKIIVKEGTIQLVVGVGSTTGTWKHVIYYRPMTPDAGVV